MNTLQKIKIIRKIKAIRAACITANLNRGWTVEVNRTDSMDLPVRLADVLLAIGSDEIYVGASTGQFGETTPDGVFIGGFPKWNLYHDDLNLQGEECISFIYELVK